MSPIRGRMRRRTSRYVVLALTASTLAGVGLNQASPAQAMDGRRLCMYVDGKKYGDVWKFIVANYKKDGKCPYVNPDRPPYLVSEDPNDIPKMTCEEFSDWVGYADDICRVLEKDSLYQVLFNEETMEDVTWQRLGKVSDFG